MESQRINSVQTPIIPVLKQWISDNPGTISLGQGVVSYGPPENAFTYMKDALSQKNLHTYKATEGIPPLIKEIEQKLKNENGIIVDNETNKVFVTAGANMAFFNILLTISDPDDEIIILSPYYFNYEMAIGIAGCRAVKVPTDKNYKPDINKIKENITPKTKAILTISPNNPTGVIYEPDILREINCLCKQNKLYHISDEAYEYFTFDNNKHFSPGSIENSESYTISIYSLSKSYGMASWRIGYTVIPKNLETGMKKVQDTDLICAPVVSQYAAVGAMKCGASYCKEHLKRLVKIRSFVLDKLKSLGNKIDFSSPDGSFYIFIKINTSMSSEMLVKKLVYEYKVAVIPGSTFGAEEGCYVRFAYGALDEETISKGMERFVEAINELVG